ncbi:MAG: hypothetical protein JXB36_15030 [Gammaproteobacteria bacterium]|nr:hypothetical protein [Gammaproteobacteria bacterium]
MRTVCRNWRGATAAGMAMLLWLAAGSARAQEGADPADTTDQNLDVTMKLLPEGATRPDAVTRVIELPEALRDASRTGDAGAGRPPPADDARGRSGSGSAAADGRRGDLPAVGGASEIVRGSAAEARDRGRDGGAGRAAPDLPQAGRDAAADAAAARDAAVDARDAGGDAAAEARDAAAGARDAAADARDSGRDAAAGVRDAAADARDSGRDAAAGVRDAAADARDSGRDAAADARDAAADARDAAADARDAAAEARETGREAAADARDRGRDIAEQARRDAENRGRPN